MILERIRTSTLAACFLIVLIAFAPLQVANAGGGGGLFGNPIFEIVLTVAVAWSGVGLAVEAAIAPTLTAVVGQSLVETAFAVINAASTLYGLTTIAEAGNCLAGSNSFMFNRCEGGNNNGNNNQPSSAVQQQNALNANTVTIQSQGQSCPSGSHFVADLTPPNQCLSDGYNSCATVGHPELVCPSNQQCTADGQCQAQVNGSNCKSSSGQSCQSTANSCGMTNVGTTMCDGTCPAPVPSESSCLPPSIQISEVPSLVNPGSSCTISWTVNNATKCTLTSDVSDTSLPKDVALPSGSYQSQALQAQATFTLSCQNGAVVTNSGSIVCHINPQFQAI